LSRDRQPSRPEERIALGELDRFSERLSVSDAVMQEAEGLCMECLERGVAKGRGTSQIAAASVYAACRENEVPTTLTDIAAASGVSRDEIAKCYRVLVLGLDLRIPVADPTKYVSAVASRAKVSPQVEADALKILSKASKAEATAGVYPLGLTASALYLASMLDGENLTQYSAAVAAGVAESTVRKENKRLRKVIGLQ
jgi:transcription initiation factor TFIIB